jgi:peptidoglycan/LPS O-acetylase OafA/YrhL
VLGVVLVAAATSAEVARAGGLSALENRLDGVKMLALAGVAAYLAARGASARPAPRWLRATAGLAAVALASSAVAYLSLSNALAWTVYVSGPLLLLWIAATGIWLTSVRRPAADRRTEPF